MADEQEKVNTEASKEQKVSPAPSQPTKEEVSKEAETKMSAPNPKPQPAAPPVDDLSQLTPAIVEALCFDSAAATEKDLRAQNNHLQSLLGKVIELLKDKSSLCANLEKQNTALMLQSNSLKDVVAITKDLLSIRNMEVDHLHVDIKSMEEKINLERERHNNMLNRMSEAVKLNENLKIEYQSQLGLFNDLRARYEEKVALLERENKRLAALAPESEATNQKPADQAGEGDVQLSLEAISPP